MGKPKKKRWEGVKKVVSCAAAAALALSLTPAAAFAADAGTYGSSGWFKLPSTQVTDFNHGGKTYLSSGIERVVGGFSQSMYYIMGINGVNFDRGLRNNDPLSSVRDLGSGNVLVTDAVTAVDGIMGTSVNASPDEFLRNSCYRLYNKQKFQSVAGEEDLEVHINSGNISAYETVNVTSGGTEYAMPVPIYHEANFISSTDSEWSNSKSVAAWTAIENARAGRHTTAAYNPYIATWTTGSGGIDYGCELMYKLAAAVDNVNTASGGALTSRYVDSSKASSDEAFYSSAKALATDYELFAKASQWYMIKQLADNPSKKKVVALLCGYQPAKSGKEAAYACRIFDTGEDTHDSSSYGGRLCNSLRNFTTDVNTVMESNDVKVAFSAKSADTKWVKWYTASDIAKYADAIFVCDAPYGNDRNTYLATNDDNTKASIYTVDNNTFDKQNQNVNAIVKAASKQNTGSDSHKVDLFYEYPTHLFGVWYAQGFENNWMGPIGAALLYSGDNLFPTVEEVMGYAARKFWHINKDDLNDVVNATCANISMPLNTDFDSSKATAGVAKVQSAIDAGVTYYNSNKSAIDKLNNGDLAKIDSDALADVSDRKSAQGEAKDARYSTTVTQASSMAQPVTVTFNADNGTANTTQVVDSGKAVAEPAAPAKDGYAFDAWYNGDAKYDFSQPVTGNVTLTAHYTFIKLDNPITASGKTASLKYKTLKKKAQTVKATKAFKVSGNQGKVTYTKASGNKKIKVASSGKITVKKGLKKGTYKVVVNVRANGNDTYNAKTVKVTAKIKVK